MITDTIIIKVLEVIIQIESENCKNIAHKSDAIGCYGLRPVALREIGVKPKLYPKEIQKQHALQYAKHILKQTKKPTINFLVYAWLNGPFAAKRKQKQYNYGIVPYRLPFADHWYLKKYYKLAPKKTLEFEFLPNSYSSPIALQD